MFLQLEHEIAECIDALSSPLLSSFRWCTCSKNAKSRYRRVTREMSSGTAIMLNGHSRPMWLDASAWMVQRDASRSQSVTWESLMILVQSEHVVSGSATQISSSSRCRVKYSDDFGMSFFCLIFFALMFYWGLPQPFWDFVLSFL